MKPVAWLSLFLAAACGDDDPKTCDPAAGTGCESGLTCEAVQGGDPGCFAPVIVFGRVFDLADESAIEGARVVGLDVNNAPVTSVAVSDVAGEYRLAVPTTRMADGTPIGADLTLRADAAGFLTFPSGFRPALPIDTSNPTLVDGEYVVASALTDIGLIALAAGGTASIHGTVGANATHASVLVVAETGAPGSARGFSAVADRDGDYKIFNLAPGSYTVTAYAKGYNYAASAVELVAGQDAQVDLSVDPGAAASTLTGSVQLVNPQMGEATSVILVVESTFDPNVARGETPPGLRAPDPGQAPSVTGAFTITGIPAGRYVVLAGFENDFLVRDASSIGGTDILHQEVVAGQDVDLAESFKVTGALDIIAPGADAPEEIAGNPTFQWVDDSSEDRYDLTVFDALGNLVWETSIPGASGDDPSVVYAGPALSSGMYYQFRVLSIKDPDEEISRTEDLRGVFFLP
jgi:hypothetical protein